MLFLLFLSRSYQIEKSTENLKEAADLQYGGQSELSEDQRLMLDACQFAQFKREHPLEMWTVGSLPNLFTCSVEKCYPRHWEL